MKAWKIVEKLCQFGWDRDYSGTCDTWKAGDPDREVDKVAVAMMPTVTLLRQVAQWGAGLLIVHEPLYYNHMDRHSEDPVEGEKRRILAESGMAVFRYHDHPHFGYPDQICRGQVEAMGLPAWVEYPGQVDLVRLTLAEAVAPVALARQLEERLGIHAIRICGNRETPITRISCLPGSPREILEELQRPETQLVMAGEACEWMQGEYARDATALGIPKTLLILGHVGSEQAGMEYVSRYLQEQIPDVEVRFFPSGEVYSYTR